MKKAGLWALTLAAVAAFAMPAFAQEGTTVRQIISYPDKHSGQAVSLEGAFQGWRKKCAGGPPLTKGDWVFIDRTACIYVSGPLPAGLEPQNAKGEPVSVRGVVQLTKRGKAYIKADEVKLLAIPAPPVPK